MCSKSTSLCVRLIIQLMFACGIGTLFSLYGINYPCYMWYFDRASVHAWALYVLLLSQCMYAPLVYTYCVKMMPVLHFCYKPLDFRHTKNINFVVYTQVSGIRILVMLVLSFLQ